MNTYFLPLIFTSIIIFYTSAIACPYGFSPDDIRPFFEQYENKIATQSIDEKEKEESCTEQKQ